MHNTSFSYFEHPTTKPHSSPLNANHESEDRHLGRKEKIVRHHVHCWRCNLPCHWVASINSALHPYVQPLCPRQPACEQGRCVWYHQAEGSGVLLRINGQQPTTLARNKVISNGQQYHGYGYYGSAPASLAWRVESSTSLGLCWKRPWIKPFECYNTTWRLMLTGMF